MGRYARKHRCRRWRRRRCCCASSAIVPRFKITELPAELVAAIADGLWDQNGPSWFALALTCTRFYDLLVAPALPACEACAESLFASVWDDATVGHTRDGTYHAADTCRCTSALPPHVHYARVTYTRFARDIDIWDCQRDGQTWKIMG